MNMGYCRFENTLRDLRDCKKAMDDGEADDLSESEQQAKEKLIRLCLRIAQDQYGAVD